MIFNALVSGGSSKLFKGLVDGSITEIKENDLKGVTEIRDNAFRDCYRLTSVVIPDGVTFISDFAFQGCSSLTSVIVKATTPPMLGADVFYHTNEELVIYVPAQSLEAYKTAWSEYADKIDSIHTQGLSYTLNGDGVSYSVKGIGTATDTDIIIPSTYNGLPVTSIGYNAFKDKNIRSIVIPDSVTSIGSSAFRGCSSLTSVVIPDGVTFISDFAFSYCSSLTSVVIPDGVTSIGNFAFRNCYNLTSVVIGDGVTSIGYDAFRDCSSLTSITCKATTPPNVESYAFATSSINTIYVPAESVDAYKSATNWSAYADKIQAITEG